MEKDLEQLYIRSEQDDSSMSFGGQGDGEIDFDTLLDELDVIDDLEALEELENTLMSQKQFEAESLDKIRRINAELKDEINIQKSNIQELDSLQDEELQRIENLMEMIKIKQQEVFQHQDQQVDNLDQFELDVTEITKMFTTAPKEYKSDALKEKIYHLHKMLEERKNIKQQDVEKVIEAQLFKKPKVQSFELPLSCLDNSITEVTSSDKRLDQVLTQITREVDKLRFDIMTKQTGSKQLF